MNRSKCGAGLFVFLATCTLAAPARADEPVTPGIPTIKLPAPALLVQSTAQPTPPAAPADAATPTPPLYPTPKEKQDRKVTDVYSDPTRRDHPAPFDSVFPTTEYVGPGIGVNQDADPNYPLNKALWNLIPELKKANIHIYGWVDPSYNISTSAKSNLPNTYNFIPNRFELDQSVINIERQADTVQTDHVDWGFVFTGLYGLDYRFTTAKGYFSNQLLKSNNLYGFDPVVMYGMLYLPKVAEGMKLTLGRYISPPDIEAQLAPQNFLFSHSEMFGVDAYTMTGLRADIKFSPMWTVGVGVHAGTDVAPWSNSAHVSGQIEAKWTSKDNNDSFYGGVDSFNQSTEFTNGHDNLQQFNLTYQHRFDSGFLTATEVYYLYSKNAYLGGTFVDGTSAFGTGGGGGAFLPGKSEAFGYVNYTEKQINKHDYLSFRTDLLFDQRGWRDAVPGTIYGTVTLGYSHKFSDLTQIRPEIKFEHSFGGLGYDGGTKNHQTVFGLDLIQRF
jgi:hypothetical protein